MTGLKNLTCLEVCQQCSCLPDWFMKCVFTSVVYSLHSAVKVAV
jgi:hypothetical protein